MSEMKQQIDDGGAAFPQLKGYANHVSDGGLSLRDYFAAKAMQGYLAGTDAEHAGYTSDAALAGSSYKVADAMLAARKAVSQ